MLLGLPSHLAPQSSARAIARACHAIATVLLVAATVVIVSVQISRPSLVLWPALLALIPMLALLLLVERVRSTLSTIAYLVIGGAAVYLYAVTTLSQISVVNTSDAFTISLPKLALVMVGGSGLYARRGPLWATVGLVAGEAAVQIATFQTGSEHRLDIATLLGYLLIVVTMGGSLVARDRARRVQPNLHRAAHDEQISSLRLEIEQQASALVHDTVLSHLAAIAHSEGDRLDPALLEAMERDLATLVGQEWLNDSRAEFVAATGDWEATELYAAVVAARESGLDVVVTGDVSAVSRLDRRRARAIGLAAAQCFTNVREHSGTMSCELVTYGSQSDLSVMVIDNGVGFTESETPGDRLGVKNSIRARIERVGGTVQIWSAPGSGTSVMIGLPLAATDELDFADTVDRAEMSERAGSGSASSGSADSGNADSGSTESTSAGSGSTDHRAFGPIRSFETTGRGVSRGRPEDAA